MSGAGGDTSLDEGTIPGSAAFAFAGTAAASKDGAALGWLSFERCEATGWAFSAPAIMPGETRRVGGLLGALGLL
jgi:hypothetical protein